MMKNRFFRHEPFVGIFRKIETHEDDVYIFASVSPLEISYEELKKQYNSICEELEKEYHLGFVEISHDKNEDWSKDIVRIGAESKDTSVIPFPLLWRFENYGVFFDYVRKKKEELNKAFEKGHYICAEAPARELSSLVEALSGLRGRQDERCVYYDSHEAKAFFCEKEHLVGEFSRIAIKYNKNNKKQKL